MTATSTTEPEPERILGMDVHAILNRCRNRDAAFEAIGGAIAARQIDVRAAAVWKINGSSRTIERGNKLDHHWAAIKEIGMEVAVWENSAVSLPMPDPQRSIEITRITFDRAQVMDFARMYGLVAPGVSVHDSIEKRGRPWKTAEWQKFYVKLIRIAQAGNLNRANYPTQTALVQELQDELDVDLDFETLRKAVASIAIECGIGRN